MILIEDAHGVVHVAQPSTDAIHWTRCGRQMSGDSHEHLGELRGAMGASLRTVVVPAGRYVDRASTCLWCVQERFLSFRVGLGVGNVGALSKMNFVTEGDS